MRQWLAVLKNIKDCNRFPHSRIVCTGVLFMTVRRKRKKGSFGKWAVWIVLLLTAFLLFLEWRVKPVVGGFAEVNAKSLATQVINQSIAEVLDEMEITCEDLETITCSETNRITSISSNAVNTNKLKSAVTLRIQKNLADIKNRELHIPIGNIIGGELMQGRGFQIPVNLSMSANVNSDFESTFEEGGINQTVHKLSVKVSADVSVRLPTGYTKTNVQTSMLIGETVIVGEVPSGMVFSAR